MKKRILGLVLMLAMMCALAPAVLSPAMAANNPYGMWQDVDEDGISEIRCTYFAWQEVYERLGIELSWCEMAYDWDDYAIAAGYAVNHTPAPGTVLVINSGAGHVAYVTDVGDDLDQLGRLATCTVNEGGRTDIDHTPSQGRAYGREYTIDYDTMCFIHFEHSAASVDRGQNGVYMTGENAVIRLNCTHFDNAVLRIHHTPAGGSTYRYWEGMLNTNTYSLALTQPGYYSAYFEIHAGNCTGYSESVGWLVTEPMEVTVDPNGGTWRGSSGTQTVDAPPSGVRIEDPAREGYRFTGWEVSGSGKMTPAGLNAPYGTPMYSDSSFYENIQIYNNKNNGSVTHTLIAKDADCPSDSDKMIMIQTSGEASPSMGGFMQYTQASMRGIYYHVFTAKVPVGYELNCIANSLGYQSKMTWITDNRGTGAWETYVYKVECGYTGNIQTFGHVYLSPEEGSPDTATWYLGASNIYNATMIINGKNTDPYFTASKPLLFYNTLQNGTVTIERISKDSTCPTTSSYYARVKTSGAASPGLGGVAFQATSKPGGVFYQVMVAKIPAGYELAYAANNTGSGSTHEWLTDTAGTGDWETYVCRTDCGTTGTFETLGFWFIRPLNGQTTVMWYICTANVFDCTPAFTPGTSDATLTAQWERTGDTSGSIITLNDYTDGKAAVSGIIDGEAYTGDTAFTVTCDNACVVAYSADGGETYTKLAASGAGDTRGFTVSVNGEVTVAVALKGDPTLDGKVNTTDVTQLKRYIAGKRTFDQFQQFASEVTNDNKINTTDVTQLKRFIAGKRTFEW